MGSCLSRQEIREMKRTNTELQERLQAMTESRAYFAELASARLETLTTAKGEGNKAVCEVSRLERQIVQINHERRALRRRLGRRM